jgi:hypothetical protein
LTTVASQALFLLFILVIFTLSRFQNHLIIDLQLLQFRSLIMDTQSAKKRKRVVLVMDRLDEVDLPVSESDSPIHKKRKINDTQESKSTTTDEDNNTFDSDASINTENSTTTVSNTHEFEALLPTVTGPILDDNEINDTSKDQHHLQTYASLIANSWLAVSSSSGGWFFCWALQPDDSLGKPSVCNTFLCLLLLLPVSIHLCS